MTAPRIHIANRPPAPSGRARGRCGVWSLYFTSRAEEATCRRCLAVAPPPPPEDLARKITTGESAG
jgi:hypothetical protein